MAWEHCGVSSLDDDATCPSCGISKAQWTVEFNVTRTFTLSAAKRPTLRLELLDQDERPLSDEPYRITLPDGTVVEGALDEVGFAKHVTPAACECLVEFPNRARGDVACPDATEADGPPDGPARFQVRTGPRWAFRVGGKTQFKLIPDAGVSLVGLSYRLTLPDGAVLEGSVDDGLKICAPHDCAPGEVRLELTLADGHRVYREADEDGDPAGDAPADDADGAADDAGPEEWDAHKGEYEGLADVVPEDDPTADPAPSDF